MQRIEHDKDENALPRKETGEAMGAKADQGLSSIT